MFAVINIGSKQYTVSIGSIIKTETVSQNIGEKFFADDVKMLHDGNKNIYGSKNCEKSGAKVECVVLHKKKDEKILVFKKKRRHNYRRKRGHRQNICILKILNLISS